MKALLAVLAMAALIVVVMRMRAPYAYLGKGYCTNGYIEDDKKVRNVADTLDKCKAACDNNPECKYMAFNDTDAGPDENTVRSLYREVRILGCNPSGTLDLPLAQNYSSYQKK